MTPAGVFGDALKTLQKRPIVAVGGLVALFLGARLVGGGGGNDPTGDPTDGTTTDDTTTDPTLDPGYGGDYYPPTDPYAGYYPPTDSYPFPTPTPLPIPDPMPPIDIGCGVEPDVPPGAKGDWQCVGGRWTWLPDSAPDPGTPNKRPPKPPIPDGQQGKGHWHWSRAKKKWVWVPKTADTPTPKPPKTPHDPKPPKKPHDPRTPHDPKPPPAGGCSVATLRLQGGRHTLMSIGASGVVTSQTPVTMTAAAQWCAGPTGAAYIVGTKPGSVTRANPEGVPTRRQITVAQLRSGPHSGKWVNVHDAGTSYTRK